MGRKTALWSYRLTFHVEHHGMRGDLLLDDFLRIHI